MIRQVLKSRGFNFLLTFMYIFAFKVYSFVDSSIIVGIFLTALFIFSERYRSCFLSTFNKLTKYIKKIIIVFALLFIWSEVVVIINKTFSIDYLKTLLHFFVILFIGLELFIYYKLYNNEKKIINHVIIVFIIQSILQLLFFVFPDLSHLFDAFRSESMITLGKHYHNVRGLAITKSGFFSLSSSYGVIILLYFTKYNTLSNNKFIKILNFLIILLGTFFAGRVGFVSLLFVPFLNIEKVKKYFKRSRKKILIELLCCISILFVFYYITIQIPRVKTLYNYSFEMVNNLFSGNGLQTTSTNKLLKMYETKIPLKTFVIGDGKYSVTVNDKKSYYMNVDVGFLRKIFYSGLLGIILSFILQLMIFDKKIKKKENIILIIYLLVLELKGEVIGISMMVNSILILYFLMLMNEENTDMVKKQVKSTKKVSVIVPIYNCEKYIEKTVDSILGQKYENIEIVLVDDGSTDNTRNILEKKYKNNKKIKLIFQKNSGAPTARNNGFKNSTGDYIIYFDSDDYMDENYLNVALNNIDEYDLVITAFYKINDNEEIVNTWKYNYDDETDNFESLYLIPPFPDNKIYKRSIIEKNNIQFDNVKMAQDLNFYIKYLNFVKKVNFIEEPCLYYRNRAKSISRTYNLNLFDVNKSITLAQSFLDNDKSIDIIKMVRVKHYTTQVLKIENYDKANGIKIIAFFKEKSKQENIFSLKWKYKKKVLKYIIYLRMVFLLPYNLTMFLTKLLKKVI